MADERKRMNAYEREALSALYGVENLLRSYQGQYKKAAERVPNGWRDYRLITTTLRKLIQKILDTVPEEQLQVMLHQAEITEVRVQTRQLPGKSKDHWVFSRDDAAYLLDAAAEGKCLMCDDPAGHNCRLRKIIIETPVTSNPMIVGCMRKK